MEDWCTYEQRLKHYFIANGVTEAGRKRSILLTVSGTFKLLRSLSNNQQDTLSYADLVKLLKAHYNPKPSAIVQRFHFNSRIRTKSESIADYVAALRDLALDCDYGDSLAQMLRDRLVCGVNHAGIQRKLLAQADLTFETAYTLALSVEASEWDTKTLGKQGMEHATPPATPGMVNYTGHSKQPMHQFRITCFRCGAPHLAPQCPHIDKTCSFCKKKGHLESVCKSKLRQSTLGSAHQGHQSRGSAHQCHQSRGSAHQGHQSRGSAHQGHQSRGSAHQGHHSWGSAHQGRHVQGSAHQGRQDKKTSKPTHYVAEQPSSESEDESHHHLFTITHKPSKPYLLDVFLNNVPVKMELDTGASVSVIKVRMMYLYMHH